MMKNDQSSCGDRFDYTKNILQGGILQGFNSCGITRVNKSNRILFFVFLRRLICHRAKDYRQFIFYLI